MEMESNFHEESINSSEEISKGEEENDVDLGVGRSYECVFCKRGFNTAQALGGHMNIHRKDRVTKNKQSTSNNNSKKQEEINNTGPRLYQQLAAAPSYNNYQISDNSAPHDDHQPHLMMSYMTRSIPLDGRDCDHQRALNLLIPDDWHMGFSTKEDMEILNQKEELDLELRLGYI